MSRTQPKGGSHLEPPIAYLAGRDTGWYLLANHLAMKLASISSALQPVAPQSACGGDADDSRAQSDRRPREEDAMSMTRGKKRYLR